MLARRDRAGQGGCPGARGPDDRRRGGGKVLDTARAAAADLGLPVVNCPTVASSDAPCSALSVIYTDEGVFQEYRFYRKNPDLVLVDTEVIAQAPPRLLVAGMGDAWHLVRGQDVRRGVCEEHARRRLDSERGAGRTVLQDPAGGRCRSAPGRSDQGRHPCAWSGWSRPTRCCRAGFRVLGVGGGPRRPQWPDRGAGTHPYFHGEKVAFGLLVQLVLEGHPCASVEQVLGFSTEVGLPITLAEIGLPDLPGELLCQIARRATAPGETIHNEPFEVTPDMVADAILAADALGRAWKRWNRERQ